jgi:hypothetical protein
VVRIRFSESFEGIVFRVSRELKRIRVAGARGDSGQPRPCRLVERLSGIECIVVNFKSLSFA